MKNDEDKDWFDEIAEAFTKRQRLGVGFMFWGMLMCIFIPDQADPEYTGQTVLGAFLMIAGLRDFILGTKQ